MSPWLFILAARSPRSSIRNRPTCDSSMSRQGSTLATLESPDSTWTPSLAFSPDGRYLAAAQSDQRVNVWDLASISHRLDAMHLATGLPDIFGGRGPPTRIPAVDRIEFDSDAAGD